MAIDKSLVAFAQREVCPRCRKAAVACYCKALRPFTAPFGVGILQHPYEARNAIATARMTHLSIKNSQIFVDIDFSKNVRVNELLADRSLRHVMLYPSRDAVDLSECFGEADVETGAEMGRETGGSRQLFVWVLDAKWQHVNQMLRSSPNLQAIPMVKFNPDRESQFIIRKQPAAMCLSTIESIHLVIDRFFAQKGLPNQEHHALLDAFQYLVQQQLEFARVIGFRRHRRRGHSEIVRGV